MEAASRALPDHKPVHAIAYLTLLAGFGGMVLSFVFLASDHHLDVIAGAAGFVAASLLAASSLLSLVWMRRSLTDETVQETSHVLAFTSPAAVESWIEHFQRNRENRPEPDWNAPIALGAEVVRPLVRSLEQFQLGDGGGPAYLIAWDMERFLESGTGTRALVDLWFAEERQHARLLAAAVSRFGGHCIRSHWSFTVFCLTRRWLGVRFELTVLLLTEIVSTVYYRLMRRHGMDPALRSMCQLILRDECGHVALHLDRLVHAARAGRARYGLLWEARFRLLGLAAATMLWVNHAPGLRALGATGAEYYREVWLGLSRFVGRLRRSISARDELVSGPHRTGNCIRSAGRPRMCRTSG